MRLDDNPFAVVHVNGVWHVCRVTGFSENLPILAETSNSFQTLDAALTCARRFAETTL